MIKQEFDGELSQVIQHMQHFVHQELSKLRQRGQTTITVCFASSLLKKIPLTQLEQQKEPLALFLSGLEQVNVLWKTNQSNTRHQITIELQPTSAKKEGFWQRMFAIVANDFEGKSNTQTNDTHTKSQDTSTHQSPTSHPSSSTAQPKARLARIDSALNALASELRSFVHLSNQRDDGKKVFAITQVTFQPKNSQADIDLNYYLSIHKTSAHWAARLKSHFTLPEDRKEITPYLNLSGIQFQNLHFNSQQDEDYVNVIAQQADSVDYEMQFCSEEREYVPSEKESVQSSSNHQQASVMIEIRDKVNAISPRKQTIDLTQFTVGRLGNISIYVGDRHFCSKEHLLFSKKDEQWYVQEISANLTLHNGATMIPKTDILLKSGDVFRLGARPEENTNDKYEQFPEVKINLPPKNRWHHFTYDGTEPTRTPLRTPIADPVPPQQTYNRTELTDDIKPQLYIEKWIDNTWQRAAILQTPAKVGREGGNASTPVAITVPAIYSKVSAEHLEIISFSPTHVVIKVCDNCTNGVFWYKDDDSNPQLSKGIEHRIPYDQPLFLAAQHDPKSIQIQFVRQG